MKIATNIEQSRQLAKILPIKSADMYYREVSFGVYDLVTHLPDRTFFPYPKGIPAWSLSALLKVIKDYTLQTISDGRCFIIAESDNSISYYYDEPIDACVDMIKLLKERNLL